ncbi:asparagine synthase (glutamine-hydrolyzing) [Candidatus Uhrbacteria bacterium]|nr:asparagine synthase (glutamine-hydrolyzing) [Candidatus Uhrbacteria bacterium]
MCGIAGFAGPGGTSDVLRKMSGAIRRRGPDDEGFHEADGMGFAFRRLSIIDVAGGHQPLSNEDGTVWVMLNGEIYGFASLREELERAGHRFTTKSDTEIIAHGYEEWGDSVFEKLNGMFAIAIWDVKRSRLVLARDRLGKKPLYWTMKDGTLWFASELKALLENGVVSKELDVVSMGAYFRSDAVPTPRTIFQNVQKLESASAMSWEKGVSKTWSFWKPETADIPTDPKEIVAGLRERLDLAVKERLVSDVPLGMFLSGGIDSSVIAESAARQSSSKLKAFTIGFDDASHDERPAAREVAKALNIELHEETLTPEAALGMMEEAVALLDEPLADPAILPQLLLARFTRKHVTVALTGDGGDELLLGYQHIPAHVWMNRVPGFLQRAARIIERIPAGTGYFSLGFKLQRLARGLGELSPWSRDLAWRGSWTRDDLSSLLRPEIRAQVQPDYADKQFAERASEVGEVSFWKKWSWGYLRTYLMDDVLVKVDRATMWFSLEARSPLLDPRVVSYLWSVPDQFKLGAWKKKRLLKELVRGRIPDEILDRPKHGFAVPIAEWLRGPLAPKLAEVADTAYLQKQGLFEPSFIQKVIEEHRSGRKDRRKELWAFLMFQLWYGTWH